MILSVLFVGVVYAGGKDTWQKAQKHLMNHEYEKALNKYLELYEADIDNYSINFKIGYCYLHTERVNNISKAIDYLITATEEIDKTYRDRYRQSKAPAEAHYYLAIAYRLQRDYEMAVIEFQAYLKQDGRNEKALSDDFINREIKCCQYSMTHDLEESRVEIYNFDVNIPEGKYLRCPVVSGNDSVFVYTLGKENIYPPDINVGIDTYELPLDSIFYSVWENGTWSEPVLINADIKLKGHTMPVSLNYDGTRLLMVHDDFDDGNIYESKIKNGKWTTARKLGDAINTRQWESHAQLSRDEEKLFFTSARKGGQGGLDIYVSHKQANGSWGEPVNLGEEINTPFHEELPFSIYNGRALYFSSEGQGNMGGFDAFSTMYDTTESRWHNPVNLGYPYNTVGNDLAYIVIFHEQFIYCPQNSNKRRTDIEGSDCFNLRMPEKKHVVALKGDFILSDMDETMPEDLLAYIIDEETGDTLAILQVDEKGQFRFPDVPLGKDIRIAFKSEYGEFEDIVLNVPADTKQIEYVVDLYLDKKELAVLPTDTTKDELAVADSIKDTQASITKPEQDIERITVKNLLFTFDKYAVQQKYKDNLRRLAEFMAKHPEYAIELHGHCDHLGTDSYNKWLGKMRSKSVKEFLIAHGAHADKIEVFSHGETAPLAQSVADNAVRKYNRRVEIILKEDTDLIEVLPIDVPEKHKLN